MDIVDFVRSQGGLVHRSVLRTRGVTAARLRVDLDSGRLIGVGRLRVATPDCDADLIAAAQAGGALACLSAARYRGLWTIDDNKLHVTVPNDSSRVRTRERPTTVHWGSEPLPRPLTAPIEPVVNMLVHIASCQHFEHAVAVVDSAINLGLVAHAELRRFSPRDLAYRRVIDAADGRADSGLESLLRVRLAACGVLVQPQAMVDGHRVDALIGDRLVIQIDGYQWHSTPAARRRDLEQDARLALRGYTVLRFDYTQIVNDWYHVERTILAAMAQSLHLTAR